MIALHIMHILRAPFYIKSSHNIGYWEKKYEMKVLRNPYQQGLFMEMMRADVKNYWCIHYRQN
jgi:hypothetical protein